MSIPHRLTPLWVSLGVVFCFFTLPSTQAETQNTDKPAKSAKKSGTHSSSSEKKASPPDSDDPSSKAPPEEIRKADLPSPTTPPSKTSKPAQVSVFSPDELAGFEDYPAPVQQLITKAAELTKQNLTYIFGSSDPKSGGMDCSGTIYRLLQDGGIKETPRQSDEMCRWIMKQAMLHRTEKADTFSNTLFSSMEPGDLAFWTGTYEASPQRDPPITHVMMYLGIRKKDGKPIVFGASDGRSYDGQKRCGVSVFDFVLPKKDGKATFYGYGPIPKK